MIVRQLQDAEKTDRKIVSEGWDSTRLLLKNDNMGFSFHITTHYCPVKPKQSQRPAAQRPHWSMAAVNCWDVTGPKSSGGLLN
jgi:hypothetical protein